MFVQFRKETDPYLADRTFCPQIEIVYPAQDHSSYVTGQDFYVIGRFHGISLSDDARLQIQLRDKTAGRPVRTLICRRKNDTDGVFLDPELTGDTGERTIRTSGMPDLVYDPACPESVSYTWNKIWFDDVCFSGLVYGGTYSRSRICQNDQDGRRLKPLSAGQYELIVTLVSHGKEYVSGQSVRIRDNTKEIILSRFTDPTHMARVKQFASDRGFKTFTDPYAGIWDTQYFSFPWHRPDVHLEIEGRWQWADAREYLSGRVHCFDYLLTENCIGYRVELGTMLAQDPECACDPSRLTVYYYPDGTAGIGRRLSVFEQNRFLAVTGLEYNGRKITVCSVARPIPAKAQNTGGCSYRVVNRIAQIRYSVLKQPGRSLCTFTLPVGRTHSMEDGTAEQLLLESRHTFGIPECIADVCTLRIEALDRYGTVWDEQSRRIGAPARQKAYS